MLIKITFIGTGSEIADNKEIILEAIHDAITAQEWSPDAEAVLRARHATVESTVFLEIK